MKNVSNVTYNNKVAIGKQGGLESVMVLWT